MAAPTRRGWLIVLTLAVVCTTPPIVPETDSPAPEPSQSALHESSAATFGPSAPIQEALVARVVDGDTIHVLIDGVDYPLRYIGIDSPETVDPNSPVGWFGPEATAANEQLVGGQTVYLEKDVSETDSFGRLLRYVWLDLPAGWLLVNEELVRLGAASSIAYPPDTLYQSLFDAAQEAARTAGLGLWGASPTLAPTPTPVSLAQPSAACDPSYPTVCIPPYPPDLDCGDVSFRRFQVLPPDPHGFDGNHDGVGCESG